MKTKGMGIALLSAAALLGSAAQAGELPWTYAEIGYNDVDGDDTFETKAFDIKGSIGFGDLWHASLQYIDGDTDSNTTDEDGDFDGFNIAIGAHPQITPDTQLVGEVSYYDLDADGGEGGGGGDLNVDGFGLAVGLRHSLTDAIELSGKINWVHGNYDVSGAFGGDIDYHDTSVEFGGRYNWTSNISTGLTVGINGAGATGVVDSGDVIRFDVRWSFAGDVSK